MRSSFKTFLFGCLIGPVLVAHLAHADTPSAPGDFESPSPRAAQVVESVTTKVTVSAKSATITVNAVKSSTPTPHVVIDGEQLEPNKIGGVLPTMALAFKKKEYTLGFGLLLTILIAIIHATKAGTYVPDEWKKWTTMVTAMLASVAAGLQEGKAWSDILVTGVIVGFIAIGGYETAGKAAKAATQSATVKLRSRK